MQFKKLKKSATNISKISGMILTEALVAVATLATGVIILSSIINNAISSTIVSKDYLVAQNLLTESVEAVKNIRDTNWLIRPDKKECWMMTDPNDYVANPNCDAALPEENSNYVSIFGNNGWSLKKIANGAGLDLTSNQAALKAPYRLYQIDVAGAKKFVSSANVLPDSTKFYRAVKFSNVSMDSIEFEAKVQWLDGAKTRTVSRSFKMYNYL